MFSFQIVDEFLKKLRDTGESDFGSQVREYLIEEGYMDEDGRITERGLRRLECQ